MGLFNLKQKMQHSFSFIDGLSEVAERYDYFILDIFGIIHDGVELFPGTMQCLEELNAMGKQICLLSNSPRRARGAVKQMEYMGLPSSLFHHTVTSGEATYQLLRNPENAPGERYWFIGTDDVHDLLRDLPLEKVPHVNEADFILNSIPGTSGTERVTLIENLYKAHARDLPMVCANPDLVVNIADEQFECAGTFAKIYEEMGGKVIYLGKPHAPVYESCYNFFGRPDKSKILAVGDSVHTDVTGADRFGIDSCFNICGIHWEELTLDHAPEVSDRDKVLGLLERSEHKPTYIIEGFQW